MRITWPLYIRASTSRPDVLNMRSDVDLFSFLRAPLHVRGVDETTKSLCLLLPWPATTTAQVDRSMTEMEFIRRRLEGGTLYALLAEESSSYLHVGPFADADMELLGTSFAKVR